MVVIPGYYRVPLLAKEAVPPGQCWVPYLPALGRIVNSNFQGPRLSSEGACNPTRAQHRDLELKHKSGATFTFAV